MSFIIGPDEKPFVDAHPRGSKEELLARIRHLEREVARLQAQVTDLSWKDNPDRSGGAFTDQEIRDAGAWR